MMCSLHDEFFKRLVADGGIAQQQGKMQECATCNLEIFPPNCLRGYGNYKQYCSCARVQVPKERA